MPKKKKSLKSLSENQIKQLMRSMLSRKTTGEYYNFLNIRNAFAIQFQFYLGLRPKEMYDGKLEYFDLEKKSYYIPANNNKQRFEDFAFIPDFLIPRIKAYLKIREQFFPDNEWIFPTKSERGRIDRSYYTKVFRDAIKEIGLYYVSYKDGHGHKRATFTPYSLRAGYGTHVFDKTGDIHKTAVALRHRDIQMRTTLTYVTSNREKFRSKVTEEVFGNDIAVEKEMFENVE